MRISMIRSPLLGVCASLLLSCGGSSPPTPQTVAIDIPPPPPAPDPAPSADPEPAAPVKARQPAPRPPVSEPARSNASPTPAATAEALFEQGRALMAQGNFAAACPKLEESLRLDPGLGTLLNLAMCEEKAGRKDLACRYYMDAARMAQQQGQSAREQVAQQRFQSLGCQP